ncbi:MAG TPA: formate/nitrite transporter family protein [Pirellulales bacterium]|nr:formate/nitrite transporter family protein [Pirellulales bacterium]
MRDTQPNTPDDLAPKKSSGRIFRQEVREGRQALERSGGRLFVSGFSAGLEVGLSLLLIAIVRSEGTGSVDRLLLDLLAGTMYSFGFVVVILGRSELFTEQTTLAVLPLLAGKTTLGKVMRLWGVVYTANLLGAAACALFLVNTAPALKHLDPQVFGRIATELVEHSGWIIILSGILAGWIMGLLSWGVAAGRDTISQIVLIWMFTSVIGIARAHHAVLGTTEVLAGILVGANTWEQFAHFLFFTTIGNALGGAIFVALLKYGHARPEANPDDDGNRDR